MKKWNAILLMIVFLSGLFIQSNAQKNNRISQISSENRIPFLLNKYNDGGKSSYVMIVAHRGDWRNAPENSLEAFQNCIDEGIDAVEIDIRETKDGELVVMHDKTLNRTTNGKGNVADYTLEEIKLFNLKTGHGYPTKHKIPTFTEFLQLAKGRILIFVDKWQPTISKIIEEAKKQNCLEQIIVWERVSNGSEFTEKYTPLLTQISYIPLIIFKGEKDSENVDEILNLMPDDLKVVGIGFHSDTLSAINSQPEKIKQHGKRILIFSSDPKINAGHNDDLAVHDLENSYKWLLEKGVNIFFTDRPFLLNDYLKKTGRRHP